MSIKQILEKAWEDCKMEGVELESVNFEIQRYLGRDSVVFNVHFAGNAIEKPQNQPDE